MYFSNPIIKIEKMAIDAGLHIDELCILAGVARSTITRSKNGTSSPNFSTIKKLEKALIKHKKLKNKATINT